MNKKTIILISIIFILLIVFFAKIFFENSNQDFSLSENTGMGNL